MISYKRLGLNKHTFKIQSLNDIHGKQWLDVYLSRVSESNHIAQFSSKSTVLYKEFMERNVQYCCTFKAHLIIHLYIKGVPYNVSTIRKS